MSISIKNSNLISYVRQWEILAKNSFFLGTLYIYLSRGKSENNIVKGVNILAFYLNKDKKLSIRT